MTHPILARQLRRAGLDPGGVPTSDEWERFLQSVEDAYRASDDDRDLVQRALKVSWREMNDLHTAVSEQRDHLRMILDVLDDGLMVFDKNLDLVEINPEALRLTRMTSADAEAFNLGLLLEMPGVEDRILKMVRSLLNFKEERPGYTRIDDVQVILASGEMTKLSFGYIPVAEDDELQSVVVVMRDLSELKKYEMELRHAQKLEAVGRLASGIAHEINTPVQFVADNIRFFIDGFDAFDQALNAADALYVAAAACNLNSPTVNNYASVVDDADISFFRGDMSRALKQSTDGMERVATIVRAMKTFAHPDSIERSPADLNNAIKSTLTVARSEIKYVATVELDLGDLPLVPCYVGDLNQVFLNLLVNAAHAIGDGVENTTNRGVVTVKTYVEGDDAVFQISDTGTGIPESAREHIFEPFFTTKKVGRGTGQGLALAHKIVVETHGGELSFETTVGEGTTFTIRLPLSI